MRLTKYIKRGYQDVLNILYPRLCLHCDTLLHEQEQIICHKCQAGLGFSGLNPDSRNQLWQRLSPIVAIEKASALFLFNKSGTIQQLIHSLKYEGHQEIGKLMAQYAGNFYKDTSFIPEVDFIIPVPLHPKKQKKRGYNQMTVFGENLGNRFGVEYKENILLRQVYTESQTRKTAEERRKNVAGAFKVTNGQKHAGKHFLIIDDVITTGATIEACIETLHNEIPNAKVSVLAMAVVL